MIKNTIMLEAFERELIKKEQVDVLRNFRIVDAMYEEAVALGALPLKDPLEGLEVDVRIAKAVNHVSTTPR
jgi:hypothetical protein